MSDINDLKRFVINKSLSLEERRQLQEVERRRRDAPITPSRLGVRGRGADTEPVSVKSEARNLATSLTALASQLKKVQTAHQALMKKARTDPNQSNAGFIEQEIGDVIDSTISRIDYIEPWGDLELLAKKLIVVTKKLK